VKEVLEVKIVTQKLMVRRNIVPGQKTYMQYPLALFVEYNDDGSVASTGMCASGAMEIPHDLNLSYSEVDGMADGYRPEATPMFDPNFLIQFDELATRVEI